MISQQKIQHIFVVLQIVTNLDVQKYMIKEKQKNIFWKKDASLETDHRSQW